MRSTRTASLAGSPTMVGAITVLVAIVAVFLSYQANSGLPFVPTYTVSAEIPNANTLVPGNEVRVGGIRVGRISKIVPLNHDDGTVSAKVSMELDQDMQPLPEDSTLVVRSRSALGLKYLEVRRGFSEDGFPAGSTIPIENSRPEPVELDEVFNVFDAPTRAAIQDNLTEFGNALAGRGGNLNAAIGELRPLVERLEPVMRTLGAPDTGLGQLVRNLAATAAEVAPVAEAQAQLFVDLETTFAAFADVARPYIQDSISKSPETEATAIRALPRIRPLLDNTAGLFADLRPGFSALRPQASTFADAVTAGVAALRASPDLNAELDPTAQSLLDLSNDPVSREGIRDLTDFNDTLAAPLRFIAPAQSVCNYLSLFFRNTSSFLRFGDEVGTHQRTIVLGPPEAPNSELGPSAAPANGGNFSNFLHYNPYPNTAAPGQTRECEAGNETYISGRKVIGNVPGNQGILTDEQLPEQKAGP